VKPSIRIRKGLGQDICRDVAAHQESVKKNWLAERERIVNSPDSLFDWLREIDEKLHRRRKQDSTSSQLRK